MSKTIKLLFLVLFLFILTQSIFSEVVISQQNVFDFIKTYGKTKRINPNEQFLWSGTISKIEYINNLCRIEIIKSKWKGTEKLITYTYILETTDKSIIKQVKKMELHKKVVVILKVNKVIENVPFCHPLLIREI